MKAKTAKGRSRAVQLRVGSARRGAQAGLVYIETILVCGLLTILLAATGFAFDLFTAKLDSLYAARQAAWERAMPGCRWQSACSGPSRSGEGQAVVQNEFETSWAARLETHTVVSCNEPPRDDESLSDVLRTFQTEVAKTGPRTVPVIAITALLTAIQSAAQLGQQAIQCVRRSVEDSPAAEAVMPLIREAVERATR
jgi:hypothetical protein